MTDKLTLQAYKTLLGRMPLFLMLLLTAVFSASSFSMSMHQLVKEQQIDIESWIGARDSPKTEDDIATFSVNEQIILSVDIGSSRWFTSGTRISSIEVANVIAKQRNQFATNYTVRKNGETWSRQRWEITLYPLASGHYVVPKLAVNVEVSAPDGSKVAGTLYTKPIEFKTVLPSGLLSESMNWFSATAVQVEQEWQQSSPQPKVGDTITRRVTIRAQDSLSILLPDLLASSSTDVYQAYPQPNQLDDSQLRGNYISSRAEEVVYVIQQGGEIELPELKFHWWNSETQTLETAAVSGHTFKATHTLSSWLTAYSSYLVGLLVGLTFILFLGATIRRYYQNHPHPNWLVFYRLLKAERWPQVRCFLYQRLRIQHAQLELSELKSTDTWRQDSARLQNGEEDKNLMRRIWQGLLCRRNLTGRFVLPKALPNIQLRSKKKVNATQS